MRLNEKEKAVNAFLEAHDQGLREVYRWYFTTPDASAKLLEWHEGILSALDLDILQRLIDWHTAYPVTEILGGTTTSFGYPEGGATFLLEPISSENVDTHAYFWTDEDKDAWDTEKDPPNMIERRHAA